MMNIRHFAQLKSDLFLFEKGLYWPALSTLQLNMLNCCCVNLSLYQPTVFSYGACNWCIFFVSTALYCATCH